MFMQELTSAPKLLSQMNAWASQTSQSQQDAATLIQELFRRIQVLGEAVQQIPRNVCGQFRSQLQAEMEGRENQTFDLMWRVTALENMCRDMMTRLSALEVSSQRSAFEIDTLCFDLPVSAREFASLRVQLDALQNVAGWSACASWCLARHGQLPSQPARRAGRSSAPEKRSRAQLAWWCVRHT